MARTRQKESYQLLRGTFNHRTGKGGKKTYRAGERIVFEDFEAEVPPLFHNQFKRIGGKPVVKSKKGAISSDKYDIQPAGERYHYNVFEKESGELLNSEPIHKKKAVREFIEGLSK